jgi:hypothetical protein
LHSEIQLRNNLAKGDLTVTPVLRLGDGAETALSPVIIKPQEIRVIDIGAAVTGTAPHSATDNYLTQFAAYSALLPPATPIYIEVTAEGIRRGSLAERPSKMQSLLN